MQSAMYYLKCYDQYIFDKCQKHTRISDLSKEGMLQAIKDKDLRFLQVSSE